MILYSFRQMELFALRGLANYIILLDERNRFSILNTI